MNYQNIVATPLGNTALGTTYSTLYTTPANTRTFVKQLDICNTTAAAIGCYFHLVPSGGAADTTNALLYNVSIPANSLFQWSGSQITASGTSIQLKASAVGLAVTASGGEAT